MLSSVRARITIVATAIVAIAMILASWIIVQTVERDLVDATERALAAELELELSEPPDFDDDFGFFEFETDDRDLGLGLFTVEEEGVAFGQLYEKGFIIGEVFIDVQDFSIIEVIDPKTGFPIADPALIADLEDAAFDAVRIDEDFDEVFDGEFETGQALLVGAAARDEVDDSLEAVRGALILIVPALVLIMGGLIWVLVGRALRPVGAMSERVEAISTSSLDQRVPVPSGRDEINRLATVMNGMLDRLQRGDRQQRQFAADASHELRSPLSTVRAAAEMIETSPANDRTERLAGDIVAEADRMERLIGDLLRLSRADEDQVTADFEVLDLGQLVAGFDPPPADHDAPDSGTRRTIEVQPGLLIEGSSDQLVRVVDNLITNAERHARSQVAVRVTAAAGHVVLRVDDDGDGVDDADRERIFERFSRLDQARSRDRGGAGLGLSLVHAIVTRHGGTVHVERAAMGGASFVVRLPAAEV